MSPTCSPSPDHRGALDALLNQFLQCQIPLSEFEGRFGAYYLTTIPDDGLTDAEWDYYTVVHEKLELTSEDPDALDRADGWIDESQLRRWLADHVRFAPPMPPTRD